MKIAENIEIKIGNTLFVVTEEFSQTSTETAEQKLKKLINGHASNRKNVIKKLSNTADKPLAMCGDKSEYGQYQNENRRSSNEEKTS